jgi:glycosyltransferase involved in cell wall biosynthesis
LASLERGRTFHFRLKQTGPVSSLHYAFSFGEIRSLIKRFQPDVINPHFVSGYGFAAVLAGARRYAPVFLHLWGSDVLVVPNKSWLHRQKVMLGLARADFVCGDSVFLVDAARRIFSFAAPRRVIPWGLEREFLALHKQDYHLQTPLRIIIPRSHEKVYDNTFIVRALAPLVNDNKIVLTFPDHGTQKEQFMRIARDLVSDRIRFYERADRRGFLTMMSDQDIYLSNARSDSSPASLIEAMGLGLVPVAADIPGVREWLNNESGFLYAPSIEEGLRDVITKLLAGKDNFEQLRKNNLKKVRNRALFEDNIGDTITIMRELAEGRRVS